LREKRLPPRRFYAEAEEALRAARSLGLRLIINDRADVALALGADGVHLGQDDLSPEAARRLLGDNAVIGFSTHNVSQAIEAARLPADYVAIGPVFATGTKENPDPVVGLDGLRRVRDAIGQVPLVAIGGITLEHADSVAIISSLLSNPVEIASRTRELIHKLRS
jgi:thiamine-phosphate diphosphorylase